MHGQKGPGSGPGPLKPGLGLGAMAGAALAAAACAAAAEPVSGGAAVDAARCGSLAVTRLPDTRIVSAEAVAAGAYRPPGSKVAYPDLPAFCRVVAVITPVPDSSIGIEIWLPRSGWNGRYQQVGNHGWGGTVYWGAMAPQLRRGFATGATDDGHPASSSPFDVSWAFGHPAKVDDLAWRAVHELAEKAKMIIAGYYGARPSRSYFNGCSDGGREGLREAQQFPGDFDGILSGGAVSYWTRMADTQLSVTANLKSAGLVGDRGATVLKLAQASATRDCAKTPGLVVGGVIMDPRRCGWDPHTLVCQAGQDQATCVTPQEADALSRNAGVPAAASGSEQDFTMAAGSEFDQLRFGYNRGLAPFGLGNYQLAFNDPMWNGSRYDPSSDPARLDRKMAVLNTIDPDLRRFKAAGGKLIEYHGWSDAAAMPDWTVAYYGQVVAKTGGGSLAKVQEFYRLFMMPGVGHCGTGPGPDNIGSEGFVPVSFDPEHDVVSALQAWVEHGRVPTHITASKRDSADDVMSPVRLQRPICAYPASATRSDEASPAKVSASVCKAPEPR